MTKKRYEASNWRTRTQAALGWVTLSCVLLSALALGANRPASWSLLALAVATLYLLQLLLDISSSFPQSGRKLGVPASLYAVTILWAILQIWPAVFFGGTHPVWDLVPDAISTISADPGQGRHFIMRLLCYGMVFWIGLRATANSARAYAFLRTIAVFSTALAVYGIHALLTDFNPILGAEQAYPTLSASFVNRNSYATYAVFGVFANLAVYLSSSGNIETLGGSWQQMLRNGLERFFGGAWLYVIGIALCMGAVALSQSRAGAMSGILGLGAFLIAWRGKSKTGNPILIIGIAIMLIFVSWISATGIGARLLTSPTENLRFAIYPEVISGIGDRPFLGHGLGAFSDAFRAHVPFEAATGEWAMAHNTYLENVYELGLPGSLAFYSALGLIAWKIRKGTLERRRDRVFTCFAFGCVTTAAFHSTLDFSLQMPASAALFAFILGMGWAQSFSSPKSPSRFRKDNDG